VKKRKIKLKDTILPSHSLEKFQWEK